jgi:hypothetical protein
VSTAGLRSISVDGCLGVLGLVDVDDDHVLGFVEDSRALLRIKTQWCELCANYDISLLNPRGAREITAGTGCPTRASQRVPLLFWIAPWFALAATSSSPDRDDQTRRHD